jgi:chlorobactene glucosyltransferase
VEIILSLGWSVLVAYLILRAARQDRAFVRLLPSETPSPGSAPRVAVIVPARDEAANIGTCVARLLRQTYPAERLRIIVVDDQSSDGTREIVRGLAALHARVRLVASPPLPVGWTGKSHACWVGAQAASDAEWLCFIDADVRAEPMLLATAMRKIGDSQVDLLSLSPRQEFGSFAERLVMPCGFYLLAFSRTLDRRGEDDVTASGQFMLLSRDRYMKIGGHAAVRADICEDLELARLVKRHGGQVALYGGGDLLSARMYTGWRTLWIGLSKNLVDLLGGPRATILTSLLVVVLAWTGLLLPLAEGLACRAGQDHVCAAFAIAFVASLAAFAFHVAGARFFAVPLWYGLLFPLGYTAGALMALDSVRRRRTGRVIWKGRTYS